MAPWVMLQASDNTTTVRVINDRQFIGQTPNGSRPAELLELIVEGENYFVAEYVFDWISPATNVGTVSFFASSVAGNCGGTERSDKSYDDSLVVTPE